MINSKNGIIGLAIGDAMGVPVEFYKREKLIKDPVTSMLGYASNNLPKGSWSDDTSMTLATITSIIKKKTIQTSDIIDNLLKWKNEGKFTPAGKMFGIEKDTKKALERYENKEETEKFNIQKDNNSNGALVRMLPLVYYCYAKCMNDEDILKEVKKATLITHKNEINVMGCYMYVIFAIELLREGSFKEAYEKIKGLSYYRFTENCVKKYDRILNNDISEYKLNKIKSTENIVDTLEATLWVIFNTESYNQAIIGAINLGNDTDTIGACVGGLAGIKYGIENINPDWKIDLIQYNYITRICNSFNNLLNELYEDSKYVSIDYLPKDVEYNNIEIVKGDITNIKTHGIVNSASESLLAGSGLCGAIHLVAGKMLEEKCKELNGCKCGEAKITRGYNMPSNFIIHTVPPKWYDETITNKEELLRKCYKNIFELACDYGIKTIALPCIGTGKYKCPVGIGAEIEINEAIKFCNYFDKIYIVCYGELEYNSYTNYFEMIKKQN